MGPAIREARTAARRRRCSDILRLDQFPNLSRELDEVEAGQTRAAESPDVYHETYCRDTRRDSGKPLRFSRTTCSEGSVRLRAHFRSSSRNFLLRMRQ